MTLLEGTLHGAGGSRPSESQSDTTWVVEVLDADNLKLAEAKQTTSYGRARLGLATRVLMWAMRVYVLLSLILIVAQIYISLKPS